MIGYKKKFTGGMGNRLFQYHFMKQLSHYLEVDDFYRETPDRKWFDNMHGKNIKWNPFRKKINFTAKNILELGKDNFLNEIKYELQNKKLIVLEPPILGDFFYEYIFSDPNDFIKIKDKYKLLKLKEDKVHIAVHFRGTDFESWNKDAILDVDYYIDSIDFIRHQESHELVFHPLTDDLTLDSYHQVIQYLNENNLCYQLGNTTQEAIYDFHKMSECDIIISSPSTFSIWAGILGKRKKIIHSEKWINNRLINNDKFWIDIDKSNNKIYKLWEKI